DSGGPLVDSNGKVVGMITAGSAGFPGFDFGNVSSSGAAYAIPIDDVSKLALQMVAGHASSNVHVGETAFLGVSVTPAGAGSGDFFGFGLGGGTASGSGVGVGGVLPGEAAQKAGLVAGDTITSIDGRSVDSPSALSNVMLGHHPGDTVRLA